MGEVIGIPHALLFHYYYPMWKAFFESLGQKVITSGETTKAIVDAGMKVTVDEACLPIKVFHGHVLALAGKCDRIFVPRIVSVEKHAFICPKFMGLPDMVKHNCKSIPQILDPCIDLSRARRKYVRAVYSTGRLFNASPLRICVAHHRATAAHRAFTTLQAGGLTPTEAMGKMGLGGAALGKSPADSVGGAGPPSGIRGERPIVVGLLGHPYLIYDPFVGIDVMRRLRSMGVSVVTADMLPAAVTEREAARLGKRMFWTIGRRLLGAGYYFLQPGNVDGCLHVSAFACGSDAFIGELLERESARRRECVPLMTITLDEHTGEAGILTRLEAFVDMIGRAKKE